jgi:hypothetical integral membrane protein (TIGR02206 family)
MTQRVFWMHKDAYAAMGGKGFSCFSLPHLIWLAVLFAGIVFFTCLYRQSQDERRNSIRKLVALFLILSEIAKQCIVCLTDGPGSTHLPLHICSFAEYVILIDALWPENRFFKPLLCYAFLPSAFMAMLFPTATAYYPLSFYAIHHFVLHASIVAYIIARYSSGEIRISYQGVWAAFLAVCVLVIPIYFIDAAFDVNFAFLMDHSNNPALKFIWDLSGGTGGISYMIGLGILVLLVLHITYGIFAAVERSRKRVSRHEVHQI